MCNNCKRCCKTCGNLDKGHCKCQPCQYVEKVKEDLVELAEEVPHDIVENKTFKDKFVSLFKKN